MLIVALHACEVLLAAALQIRVACGTPGLCERRLDGSRPSTLHISMRPANDSPEGAFMVGGHTALPDSGGNFMQCGGI